MDLREQPPAEFGRPGHWCWYGSFGTSAALHICVIAVLACIWMQGGDEPADRSIETRWSRAMVDERLDEVEQPQADVQPVEIGISGSSAAQLLTQANAPQPPVVSVPSTRRAWSPTWFTNSLTTGEFDEEVGSVVGLGNPGATGAGNGSGSGTGDGSGGKFFGSRPPGKSFVFVVDCSGSMNHPREGFAKTRFQAVRIELVKSIAAMDKDMKFFVIFFNHQPHPMPARSLQSALPEIQKRFLEWTAKRQAGGGTDPRAALLQALRLQPDVIYLLTDGDFGFKIKQDLGKMVQNRVSIHTFAFGNRNSEAMLKTIASANGGEYHYLP